MFFDELKETFISQGMTIAAKLNQDAAERFLAACRDWALNGARGNGPTPEKAVEAQFDFEGGWDMRIVTIDRPVSTIDPSSFAATFGTDNNAVGGPVGGPIPGQPGRFYAASNAAPWDGQEFVTKGKTYRYTGTSPFNRFWELVA